MGLRGVPPGTTEWKGKPTWGQQAFLNGLERYSQHSRYLNIVRAVDLPSLCSVERVSQVVSTILAKYDSLRTTYSLGGQGARQVVVDHRDADLRLLGVSGALAPFTSRVSEEMRKSPLGLSGGLPFAAAVLTLDGRPVRVLLAFSHRVVDASSARILVGEFVRLLAGDLSDRGAGIRPRDRAATEGGEHFQALSDRSINSWMGHLSDTEGLFSSPRPGMSDSRSECVQATVRLPRAAESLGVLEEEHQLASSAVLVSLTALTLAAVTDRRRIPLQVLSSNRFLAGTEGYVGLLAQSGPLVADTEVGSLALRSFVDRIGRQLWRSYRAASWSPDELDSALHQGEVCFADLAGWPTYNDVRAIAPSVGESGGPSQKGPVEWMRGWPYQDGRFAIAITSSAHTLCLSVRADTVYVSPEIVFRFLDLFARNCDAVMLSRGTMQTETVRMLEDARNDAP